MTTISTPPPPQVLYKAPEIKTGSQGLGGWLILVAIGLIISPIRIGIIELTLLGIFVDGTWSVLSNSASEFYNPTLSLIIPIEFMFNLAFIFGFIFLIYLFFTKSSNFPRWYIAVYLANLIVIILDAVAVKIAVPGQPLFDTQTTGEFLRSLAACVIWVPYMFKSKRVEATFVN